MQVAQNPGPRLQPAAAVRRHGAGQDPPDARGRQSDARATTRRAACMYLRSEQFVSGMVRALQQKDMDDFKRRFRSVDALLIDDIQFFAGKDTTQEEFFHTFNALFEGKQQIILTCDRYPKEVDSLEPRLKSRLGWGLSVAIEPPDFETRAAIVLAKAQANGRRSAGRGRVPDRQDACARTCAISRARSTRWSRARTSTGRAITPEFAQETLRDLLTRARAGDHDPQHPEDRGRLLPVAPDGPAVEAAQPFARASAADGDGAGQGADRAQPAGDRRCVRRPRPHDRAARMPARSAICCETDGKLRQDWEKLIRALTE